MVAMLRASSLQYRGNAGVLVLIRENRPWRLGLWVSCDGDGQPMADLLTAAALSLICLLLCLRALGHASRRRYALLSVLFVFVLTASTDAGKLLPANLRFPGHYNWTGKLLELITSLLAIALLSGLDKWKREDFGLRWSFDSGTGRDVLRFLLPVMFVELIALWFMVPGEMPSFEDHFFQLTAPGISEELAFRGVLLALLDRAFLSRVRILNAELGWSTLVTSLLFGLWHGLDVDGHFHVSLAVAPMVIPTLGGFVVAWCRARSGSLLLPILAHSGMNEMVNVIALVKVKMATRRPAV